MNYSMDTTHQEQKAVIVRNDSHLSGQLWPSIDKEEERLYIYIKESNLWAM